MNLLDQKQRNKAGITLSEMACTWELIVARKQTPPTWIMANHLIASGIAGIIVPSYAKNAPEDGLNIILWDWHDFPPHQAKLIDDDKRLAKNLKSWK
jgi:RES domain-containing protein